MHEDIKFVPERKTSHRIKSSNNGLGVPTNFKIRNRNLMMFMRSWFPERPLVQPPHAHCSFRSRKNSENLHNDLLDAQEEMFVLALHTYRNRLSLQKLSTHSVINTYSINLYDTRFLFPFLNDLYLCMLYSMIFISIFIYLKERRREKTNMPKN